MDDGGGDEQREYEAFLQAYAKPTQIYSYLTHRQKKSPLFLHRSLSYLQVRSKKVVRRRNVPGTADKICAALLSAQQKQQQKILFNGDCLVTVASLHAIDGSELADLRPRSARVEVCFARHCTGRRLPHREARSSSVVPLESASVPCAWMDNDEASCGDTDTASLASSETSLTSPSSPLRASLQHRTAISCEQLQRLLVTGVAAETGDRWCLQVKVTFSDVASSSAPASSSTTSVSSSSSSSTSLTTASHADERPLSPPCQRRAAPAAAAPAAAASPPDPLPSSSASSQPQAVPTAAAAAVHTPPRSHCPLPLLPSTSSSSQASSASPDAQQAVAGRHSARPSTGSPHHHHHHPHHHRLQQQQQPARTRSGNRDVAAASPRAAGSSATSPVSGVRNTRSRTNSVSSADSGSSLTARHARVKGRATSRAVVASKGSKETSFSSGNVSLSGESDAEPGPKGCGESPQSVSFTAEVPVLDQSRTLLLSGGSYDLLCRRSATPTTTGTATTTRRTAAVSSLARSSAASPLLGGDTKDSRRSGVAMPHRSPSPATRRSARLSSPPGAGGGGESPRERSGRRRARDVSRSCTSGRGPSSPARSVLSDIASSSSDGGGGVDGVGGGGARRRHAAASLALAAKSEPDAKRRCSPATTAAVAATATNADRDRGDTRPCRATSPFAVASDDDDDDNSNNTSSQSSMDDERPFQAVTLMKLLVSWPDGDPAAAAAMASPVESGKTTTTHDVDVSAAPPVVLPQSPSASSAQQQQQPPAMSSAMSSSASLLRAPSPRLGTLSTAQRVLFNFAHNGISLQQTVSRQPFHCPWCERDCRHVAALVRHLRASHPRFAFHFLVEGTRLTVNVRVNEGFDHVYSGDPHDLFCMGGGHNACPQRRKQHTKLWVARPSYCRGVVSSRTDLNAHDAMEFMDIKDAAHSDRVYFHSSCSLPLLPTEMEIDSEEEGNPGWLTNKTEMMMEEFSDVNVGEKTIMKLWNTFTLKFSPIADSQLPDLCLAFVEAHWRDVRDRNLPRNLILHLTNIRDFGLITPAQLYECHQRFVELCEQAE